MLIMYKLLGHSLNKLHLNDICSKRYMVVQCLSQDLNFFQKKELLKFFRELFAKERSYPFHDENLANVYQMRVLYARTCRNHLVNRRFRTQ